MIKSSSKDNHCAPVRISTREREILDLICAGYTNKEISKTLYISPHTVVSHKKNMRVRLGAKNVVHLVALLFKTNNSYNS